MFKFHMSPWIMVLKVARSAKYKDVILYLKDGAKERVTYEIRVVLLNFARFFLFYLEE
jgi:hypothetical protein